MFICLSVCLTFCLSFLPFPSSSVWLNNCLSASFSETYFSRMLLEFQNSASSRHGRVAYRSSRHVWPTQRSCLFSPPWSPPTGRARLAVIGTIRPVGWSVRGIGGRAASLGEPDVPTGSMVTTVLSDRRALSWSSVRHVFDFICSCKTTPEF